MSDLTPRYRTEYGTPDDGNTLGEKEYNEGEDAYHQITQLIQDGYLVPDTTLQDIADAWNEYSTADDRRGVRAAAWERVWRLLDELRLDGLNDE